MTTEQSPKKSATHTRLRAPFLPTFLLPLIVSSDGRSTRGRMSTSLTLRHTSSSGTGGGRDRRRARCGTRTDPIVEADDAYLEHLGHKPEFKRHFSFLDLFSLCPEQALCVARRGRDDLVRAYNRGAEGS